MATETLRPDVQLSCAGLATCDVLEHDEDPDVSSTTIDATGNNVNTEYGVDFPTPTGDPTVGLDLQEFRAGVIEFDSGQTGTPKARIELWENGALVRAGSDVNVSVYAVLSLAWNANELATADGSLVQCKVIGTKSGGSPGNRNTVRIGHIEWNVDYTVGGVTVTPSPATSVAAKVDPTVVKGSIALSPAVAFGIGANVDPIVVLGSLTLTPAVASAVAAKVDPMTVLGSLVLAPAPADAIGGKVDPGVVLGSLNLAPAVAWAVGTVVDPTVDIDIPTIGYNVTMDLNFSLGVDL